MVRLNHKTAALDRRSRRRFQIDEVLRYRLLYGDHIAETGTGRVLNISSSGVLFTTEVELERGTPVELSMSWPARLLDVCPMKLVIYGCVVRSDPRSAVLSVERYEFRTRGSAAMPVNDNGAVRLPA